MKSKKSCAQWLAMSSNPNNKKSKNNKNVNWQIIVAGIVRQEIASISHLAHQG